MPKPDLQQLAHWVDSTLVALLEERRRQKPELLRDGKGRVFLLS